VVRRALDRYQAWIASLIIVLLCFAAGWAIASRVSLPEGDEFNILRWEVRHIPDKWVYLAGRFFRGGLSREEQDEKVGRYLVLTARIERAAAAGAPPAELAPLRDERDGLENDVEAIIEGRLTSVLEDEGIESSLPLFPDARWVFPPVDTEFEPTPRVLIVSPRDRIELIVQQPLRSDVGAGAIEALEQRVEADGERSALVDNLAGMSTYPSVVLPRSDYESLVATVAHEWLHHYLSFRPLGLRYLESVELRTLNETVADIGGLELAALVVARYPLPPDAAAELAGLAPGGAQEEADAVLRQLRLDVEDLLAAGEVDAAEALMEQRRLELAETGVHYRRINQAFFAFRGLYATDPASIDPIGGKLKTLRAREGSLAAFLAAAAGLTSEDDLDALLGEPTAAGGTGRR
jgi:hypothetical protein